MNALRATTIHKLLVSLLAAGILNGCDNETALEAYQRESELTALRIEAMEVRTYADLQRYLEARYGSVEELPMTAILSTGEATTVPYSYRLASGIEFTIPIIFTENNERIVDPDFDLNSLP